LTAPTALKQAWCGSLEFQLPLAPAIDSVKVELGTNPPEWSQRGFGTIPPLVYNWLSRRDFFETRRWISS
jgi:hypothetical protein